MFRVPFGHQSGCLGGAWVCLLSLKLSEGCFYPSLLFGFFVEMVWMHLWRECWPKTECWGLQWHIFGDTWKSALNHRLWKLFGWGWSIRWGKLLNKGETDYVGMPKHICIVVLKEWCRESECSFKRKDRIVRLLDRMGFLPDTKDCWLSRKTDFHRFHKAYRIFTPSVSWSCLHFGVSRRALPLIERN